MTARPSTTRPVWLDTDPGFDDWLTMLLLAAHPGVNWLGMSVVAGNAPLDDTLANALAIRRLHGWTVPVHRGSDRALIGTRETAQHILGAKGLRSTGPALPPTGDLADAPDAVTALCAAVRGSPTPVTLVAIGAKG